ncbi:MAG: FHA domain-containing protein [Chloroflexota bacterium]
MSPLNNVQLFWTDPITGKQENLTAVPPITIGRRPTNDIVLGSGLVSGEHAQLEQVGEHAFILRDMGSRNGTIVDGQTLFGGSAVLHSHSQFQIGPVEFRLILPQAVAETIVPGGTRTNLLSPAALAAIRQAQRNAATITPSKIDAAQGISASSTQVRIAAQPANDFPPPAFDDHIVSMAQLNQQMPYEATTYLSIGGGLGSFTWIDHLLIYGANPDDIMTIGFEPKPYGRYRRLCENSQIPDHERLRSNSDSCPDNIWGWPGYAVREMWQHTKRGRIDKSAQIGWQIFNEPYVQTYTPVAANVFDSIDREAKRIGWDKLWRHGRVRAIRKTDDGRYAIAYSLIHSGKASTHRIVVCKHLHIAVGYPGVRFLPDLQQYRETTGDFKHVVNAYEKHNHVYEDLAQNGGVVLIRGRGIVASRIIQRLYELRQEHSAPIGILHLMRTPLAEGKQYNSAQRDVHNHWELQPFNWPKAAWGGDLRVLLEKASDEERDRLLDNWGGTTTADREDWRLMIEEGLREGWYEIEFGKVYEVAQGGDGRLITHLDSNNAIARQIQLEADYIIDATGLEASIDDNALLKDMLDHYQLSRNPKGRLNINSDFELEEMRNGDGRVFASGVITLGGPYAAVDSFLGLQYAALRSVDSLTALRAAGLRRLDGFRSLAQWTRWAIGAKP